MRTDVTNTGPADTELTVEDWRFQQLVKGRWPEQQALVLAASPDVDLHLACELLAKGCDPAIAWEILL